MQRYINNVTNSSGAAVSGATVTVTVYGGTSNAQIYSDNFGTVAANPLTTDANGYFSFYAADGRYSLSISGTGVTTQSITDIILQDNYVKQSGVGSVKRVLDTKVLEWPSALDYGADATGVADCSASFVSANTALSEVVITAGSYKVSANVTFTKPVRMLPGAVLNIATGVTVAFNGGFAAGVYQVFNITGTGLVSFALSTVASGYSEWWGAIANSSGAAAANAIAINAALAALRKVELLPGDYFVNATIVHAATNGELVGAGSLWDATYGLRATRLLMTDGSTHVLRVGGAAAGASPPSQYVRGIKVRGLQVARTVAPVVTSACDAVRVQYLLEGYFEDVRGDESMIGWEFVGTVSCKVVNCSAKRTSIGTGGSDSWRGFYANGSSPLFAGGNASLYIFRSHADDTRATTAVSSGFYADGAFSDLFLSWCETVTCGTGINIQGLGGTGGVAANTDCRIDNCTNDQFSTYGVYVNNLGPSGSVELIGGYQGPVAGATYGIFVQATSTGSSVNIEGGMLVMSAAPACVGIGLVNVSGVRISGTQIQECATTCIATNGVSNSDLQPIIKSSTASGGAGIQLNGTCNANYVKPLIYGKAALTVSIGIQVLGTLDNRSEYNCSGIDSAAVAGGSINKLVRNGVQVTVTGLSGTNLVSGVMT